MKLIYQVGLCLALTNVITLWAADQSARHVNGAVPPRILYETNALPQNLRSGTSYAPIFKKVAPSVVTVFSTKTVRADEMSPLFNDPMFRRFFGGGGDEENSARPRERVEQGLGSGVVVTQDGYILSNNHVVEDADEIKVRFHSGGPDLDAKVIGTDPPTDLAVLKVEASTNLQPITIADSTTLEVGDLVLAVGNPFGVGNSVTLGIVSATGRGGFGIMDYEDFIQTDASINPGNSGGALVDAAGRLVGVPTAILSRSGGSMGVGFAVPSSMVRYIMDRILQDGRVIRGYLGIFVQPVTPALATVFKLPNTAGALVGGVAKNGPAEKSGLEAGDVIVSMNNEPVTDARTLRLKIAQTSPNTQVNLKVLRNGQERTVQTQLAELPTEEEQTAQATQKPERQPSRRSEVLPGVEIVDLNSRARQQFSLPPEVQGALIVNVAEGSQAQEAGLRPGDVIQEINRERIRNARDVAELARKGRDQKLLLRVWSRGGSRFLVLEPRNTPQAERNR